jgi:hypothetical protein
MRGKVLGYHEGNGVIVGDDEQRFNFTMANWRDSAPPQPGMVVDFVSREGMADDIYPALGAGAGAGAGGYGAGTGSGYGPGVGAGAGAGAAGNPFGGFNQNPFVRNFIAKIRAYPQIPVAFLILLASLLFTYSSVGDPISDYLGGNAEEEARVVRGKAWANDDVSIVGLNFETGDWRSDLEERAEKASEDAGNERDNDRQRDIEEQEDIQNGMRWFLMLSHLFWLIPLLAIAVMVLYWVSRQLWGMIAAITLGILCILSPFFLVIWRGQITEYFRVYAADAERSQYRRAIENAFELGFGAYFIALLGAVLLALVFMFRRPQPTPVI